MIQINDLVVLTEKARKQFYETEQLIECFEFRGEMRTKDFKMFVNEYVGFISAETGLGIIESISCIYENEVTVKVAFCGPIGIDYHYFALKELEIL